MIESGVIEKQGISLSSSKALIRRNNSFYGRSKKGSKAKVKGPSSDPANQKIHEEAAQNYENEDFIDEHDDDFDVEDSSCKSMQEIVPAVETMPQSMAPHATPKTSGYASRANQNLTQEDARAVLEYIRTL